MKKKISNEAFRVLYITLSFAVFNFFDLLKMSHASKKKSKGLTLEGEIFLRAFAYWMPYFPDCFPSFFPPPLYA